MNLQGDSSAEQAVAARIINLARRGEAAPTVSATGSCKRRAWLKLR
jgi:hypothetical protein